MSSRTEQIINLNNEWQKHCNMKERRERNVNEYIWND